MHSIRQKLTGRILCSICAAYTAGIALCAFFSYAAAFILVALLVSTLVLAFVKPAYIFTVLIIFCSFAGGATHFYGVHTSNKRFEEKYSHRYVTVSGTVTDVSETSTGNTQIILKADSISALDKTEKRSFSACLYTDADLSVALGDKIVFSDIFAPFDMSNTHSFDSEKYFYSKNISASFSPAGDYISVSPGKLGFWDNIKSFSRRMSGKIRSAIGGDAGEVAAAITLGDRSGFSDRLTLILSKSGISHMVAVSGMHLSILVGFFFTLSAKSRLHYKLRNIFGIIIVLLYMALTGFSPSVTRAGIMTICVLAAAIADRKEDIATSFFFSAAIILAFNPYTIFSASFLLSYASLAGILTFAKPIAARLKFLPTVIRHTIAATFSATLTTLPVLAYLFNSVSLYSVITNLIAVPLISTVFILSFAVLLIPGATIFAFLPKFIIGFILLCAEAISRFPYSAINVKSPDIVWIICFAILLILIYLLVIGRKPGKSGVLAFTFVLCAVSVSLASSALTRSVTFFDIGQGDCALIKTPGFRSYLVDTGSSGQDTLSALQSAGVNNIDIIFISHTDTDHSGGLAAIMENIRVKKVVFPAYDISNENTVSLVAIVTSAGADVDFANSHTDYKFADFSADILWPEPGTVPKNENEASLVLDVDISGNKFLFTGDIGMTSETEISIPDSDVLKVAHHGSAGSTSDGFLGATSPEFSVISVGKNNFYGHPKEETLARLEKSGTTILRTDINGDITFNIDLSGNMEARYETD